MNSILQCQKHASDTNLYWIKQTNKQKPNSDVGFSWSEKGVCSIYTYDLEGLCKSEVHKNKSIELNCFKVQ